MDNKFLNPVTGRMVSRQRMYQLRKLAEGRCIQCGQRRAPKDPKFCALHRKQYTVFLREWKRRRYGRKARYPWAKSYQEKS